MRFAKAILIVVGITAAMPAQATTFVATVDISSYTITDPRPWIPPTVEHHGPINFTFDLTELNLGGSPYVPGSATSIGKTLTYYSHFFGGGGESLDVQFDRDLNGTLPTSATKFQSGYFTNGIFFHGSTGMILAGPVTAFYISTPEPATWAMMIIGFAVTGLAMRRRQTVSHSFRTNLSRSFSRV
jgi:hypothetical protein